MDPVLGRFISEDPAKDGQNWFVYCGDEPVNKVDWDGCIPFFYWAWGEFWFAMGCLCTIAALANYTWGMEKIFTKAGGVTKIFLTVTGNWAAAATFFFALSAIGVIDGFWKNVLFTGVTGGSCIGALLDNIKRLSSDINEMLKSFDPIIRNSLTASYAVAIIVEGFMLEGALASIGIDS